MQLNGRIKLDENESTPPLKIDIAEQKNKDRGGFVKRGGQQGRQTGGNFQRGGGGGGGRGGQGGYDNNYGRNNDYNRGGDRQGDRGGQRGGYNNGEFFFFFILIIISQFTLHNHFTSRYCFLISFFFILNSNLFPFNCLLV